jgi:hypothetical protein
MAAEKFDGCGPECPCRIEHRGELNEPACKYYETVCSAAIEKCKRELFNEAKNIKYSGGTVNVWPGTNRGWGPVTRKLEWE